MTRSDSAAPNEKLEKCAEKNALSTPKQAAEALKKECQTHSKAIKLQLLSVFESRYAMSSVMQKVVRKGEKGGEDSLSSGRRLQTTQQEKM